MQRILIILISSPKLSQIFHLLPTLPLHFMLQVLSVCLCLPLSLPRSSSPSSSFSSSSSYPLPPPPCLALSPFSPDLLRSTGLYFMFCCRVSHGTCSYHFGQTDWLPSSQDPPASSSSVQGLQASTTSPGFYEGVGDHACPETSLPTDPSFQN